MKRCTWTALVCLQVIAFGGAQAQDGDAAAVFAHPYRAGDPAFAEVAQRLHGARVVRADFSQEKRMTALRRPLHSGGAFLFSAEHGVWWHTTQPFVTTFTITEKGILQETDGGDRQVIEAERQPMIAGFTRVFMALFGGDTAALADRFDLYFSGDAGAWTLGLKPKGSIMGKLISGIILEGDTHMHTIHFHEASGDRTVIRFENLRLAPDTLTAEEQQRFDF